MIQTTPDPNKARALRGMARQIIDRIQETDTERFSSQIIKDYYEALHALSEAIAANNGIKTQGGGAHKQLIEYICTQCTLSMSLQTIFEQLRTYRNRITYEGFTVGSEYLKRNQKRIQHLYQKLETCLDNT